MTDRVIRYEIPEGADASTCRGCDAGILWIITKRGKKMPVDPDGTPHFATCPKASEFRKNILENAREEKA